MHIIEQTMDFSYIESHDIIDLKQMIKGRFKMLSKGDYREDHIYFVKTFN